MRRLYDARIPPAYAGGVTPERVRSPRHGDARAPSRDRILVVGSLFLLLVVAVVPWRKDSIYTGGVDPIVVIKAGVSLVTLAGAVLLWLRTRVRVPIGIGPAFAISLVLLISLLGSVVAGNAAATSVLVIRMFIVMFTVLLLLSAVPWLHALWSLLSAMALVAVVAAATGIGTLLSDGRLGGGIPEIHPNELASLSAVPLIGGVVLVLRGGVRLWALAVVVMLFTIVVASGSRTALLAVALAVVLALLSNGRLGRGVVIALLMALPVSYAIASFTDVFESLASRGGATEATGTLDSRFNAWRPVLAWSWTSWEKWIGVGLSVKEVAVDDKWVPVQVLDSSWVSLLAQGGIIGFAISAALLGWCVLSALLSRERRGLMLPLLTLILVGSLTESGLVDSAVPFVVFLAASSVLTHRSRSSPLA